MKFILRSAVLALAAAFVTFAAPALAQGTNVPFGVLRQDTSLPVEITADQLQIDQSDGSALFSGNVVIGQGEMRLSAAEVRVEYASSAGDATGGISRLLASGGVVLASGAEAAEAREAVYSIALGNIVLTGSVILTQGRNVMAADRMEIELGSGTARLNGRVRTILQPGGN
ncbi:MAG: LptA/OstA family protein [Halocynthiibacter sp.]